MAARLGRHVERTPYRIRSGRHDVRVELGGFHVLVAQEFLHRPDVVAVFEQMRGKAVPEGVRRDGPLNAGGSGREADLALNGIFQNVVAAPGARARIDRWPGGRKNVLPASRQVSIRVLTCERVWQLGTAVSLPDRLVVQRPHSLEM